MTAPDLAALIAAAKELYAKAAPGEYTFRRQWNEGNCPTLTVGEVDEFGDYLDVTEDGFRSAAFIHNIFPYLVADWERMRLENGLMLKEAARLYQDFDELLIDNERLRQRVEELEKGIRDYIERENAFGERR